MKNSYEKHDPALPLLVLHLRALILALGELSSPAWWKTDFMNETGLRFLERIYPRTFFRSAVYAAGKAASYAYDRAVGRVGVYHIFQLSEPLEAEINRISLDLDEEFVTRFRTALGQQGSLMNLLSPLCGVMETDSDSGAKKIGTDKEIMTVVGIKKTAAVYHRAFAQGKLVYPYFTAEQAAEKG